MKPECGLTTSDFCGAFFVARFFFRLRTDGLESFSALRGKGQTGGKEVFSKEGPYETWSGEQLEHHEL